MGDYTERLTVRLSEDQRETLDDIAEERSTKASTLARQIISAGIRQIVNDHEDPAQISILEEDGDQRNAF